VREKSGQTGSESEVHDAGEGMPECGAESAGAFLRIATAEVGGDQPDGFEQERAARAGDVTIEKPPIGAMRSPLFRPSPVAAREECAYR